MGEIISEVWFHSLTLPFLDLEIENPNLLCNVKILGKKHGLTWHIFPLNLFSHKLTGFVQVMIRVVRSSVLLPKWGKSFLKESAWYLYATTFLWWISSIFIPQVFLVLYQTSNMFLTDCLKIVYSQFAMLHSGKMGVDYLARKFTIPFLTTHRFLAVVTKDFRASGLGQVRRLNTATATITLACLFVSL